MTAAKLPLIADGTPFRLYHATTWLFVPEDRKLVCRFNTNEGGTGNCRGWLNGQLLPEMAMNNFDVAGTEVVRKAELSLKKGWNHVVLRGWGHWCPENFGLIVEGPEEFLWTMKYTPNKPQQKD